MKEFLTSLFQVGIHSSLPENCFRNTTLPSSDVSFASIGKAGYAMAEAFLELYKNSYYSEVTNPFPTECNFLSPKGIVITKHNHAKGDLPNTKIVESSHPIPDQDSIQAGEELIHFLQDVNAEHMVFLISGGGSSLVEKLIPGETLESLKSLTNHLLASGSPIREINAIRKEKSLLKAGGLLNYIPKHVKYVTNFIISDVLGDHLPSISSGMTMPGSNTHPSNSDNFTIENHILGGNSLALSACFESAKFKERMFNHKTYILNSRLEGEAKEIGKFLGQIAMEIQDFERPFSPPCLLLLGGETTVHLNSIPNEISQEKKGKGGRNQELAYSFALEIQGRTGITLLSAGTDGTDGPTDAAGAIVDGSTIERIREQTSKNFSNSIGMEAQDFLNRNDTYHALQVAGDLLVTGPTGTNVNDLVFLYIN